VGAAAPTSPLSAALGLSCRRLATTGDEALCRWRLQLPQPAFRCARLALQAARYRVQRCAWQVGAVAPTPPLSAALGLSCRRLDTTGNEALDRCGLPLPHPRFPLRSNFLAYGSLPRDTNATMAVESFLHRLVYERDGS
jgi:hypothetical protein